MSVDADTILIRSHASSTNPQLNQGLIMQSLSLRLHVLVRGLLAGLAMALSTSAVVAQVAVNVGSGPTLSVAGVQLALAKGYFKEEGLDVTITPLTSGAATLASLVGGSLHFVPTNIVSASIARSRGIRIKIISSQTSSSKDRPYDAILVRGDSQMKTARDLVGKTVAVNAVNSIGTLTTSRAIEKDGGDFKSVKWVELPQGDAMTALATGNVDAIYIVEPFVTIGAKRGFRRLVSPYLATDVDFAETAIVATEAYLTANPEVGKKFQRAMAKALKLGAENPEEIRAMLPSYMKIDDDVRKTLALPLFHTQLNTASVQNQINLAVQYGYIPKPVSIDELVWKAP